MLIYRIIRDLTAFGARRQWSDKTSNSAAPGGASCRSTRSWRGDSGSPSCRARSPSDRRLPGKDAPDGNATRVSNTALREALQTLDGEGTDRSAHEDRDLGARQEPVEHVRRRYSHLAARERRRCRLPGPAVRDAPDARADGGRGRGAAPQRGASRASSVTLAGAHAVGAGQQAGLHRCRRRLPPPASRGFRQIRSCARSARPSRRRSPLPSPRSAPTDDPGAASRSPIASTRRSPTPSASRPPGRRRCDDDSHPPGLELSAGQPGSLARSIDVKDYLSATLEPSLRRRSLGLDSASGAGRVAPPTRVSIGRRSTASAGRPARRSAGQPDRD